MRFGRIKKIISLALATITLCASFTACSVQKAYEGAPEGMRPINDGSDGAILYVPSAWSVDTSLSVPMGYVSAQNRTMVTLVYVDSATVNGKTAPEYWQGYKEQFTSTMTDFTIVKENEEAKDYTTRLIAGKDAYEFEFKGKVTGLDYHFRQALVKDGKGGIFIITFSAYEANYADVIGVLTDSIYPNFAFVDKIIPAPDDNTLEPEIDETVTVPEGMQLLSNKAVDYIMFVPASWSITVNTGMSAARAPEGSASVSVVGFDIRTADTDAFWSGYEADIKATFGNMTYLSEENKYDALTLAGYESARTYKFTVDKGGAVYRYSETVLIRDGYVYLITYSAKSDDFAAYEADYAKMLTEFKFK